MVVDENHKEINKSFINVVVLLFLLIFIFSLGLYVFGVAIPVVIEFFSITIINTASLVAMLIFLIRTRIIRQKLGCFGSVACSLILSYLAWIFAFYIGGAIVRKFDLPEDPTDIFLFMYFMLLLFLNLVLSVFILRRKCEHNK